MQERRRPLPGEAAGYERYGVPRGTPFTQALLALAPPQPGARALDVACGTGVVARGAAPLVGPSGRVAGLDLNQGMLAVARSLPPPDGPAIEWHEGSALDLPFHEGAFDVVLCQLGLQFFPDRPVALREVRRVLRPRGRAVVLVYAELERNPANQALAAAVERHVGAAAAVGKRAEHALGDADELRSLAGSAGFEAVEVRTTSVIVRSRLVDDLVRIQAGATPIASALDGRPVDTRQEHLRAIAADVGEALAPYVGHDGLAFPQVGHLLLARR